jgi:hypothetical protein
MSGRLTSISNKKLAVQVRIRQVSINVGTNTLQPPSEPLIHFKKPSQHKDLRRHLEAAPDNERIFVRQMPDSVPTTTSYW